MFITFLLFGNNIISVESRHLIFVYLCTRTQSIQKKIFEYDVKSKYPEEYSTVDKVGREKLLAVKSCFLYTSSPPHFFWSPSKLESTFKRVPFFVFEILIALFHCRKEKHKDSSKITDKALKTTVYEVFALVVCFAPLVISTPVSMFFSKIGRQKSQLLPFKGPARLLFWIHLFTVGGRKKWENLFSKQNAGSSARYLTNIA